RLLGRGRRRLIGSGGMRGNPGSRRESTNEHRGAREADAHAGKLRTKQAPGIFLHGARLRQRRDLTTRLKCESEHEKRGRQRFIASKNSPFDLVSFILSSRNSIAASSSIGCRSFLRIHIFASSPWSVMSSSLRVPERLMFTAGKTRFSEMRRSRWISLLPVPLNSS